MEETIRSLQGDKLALKEALRSAIQKRDELYGKVSAFDQALKTQKARTYQKEVECKHLEARIEQLLNERQMRGEQPLKVKIKPGHKHKPSFDTSQLIESAMSPRAQPLNDLLELVSNVSRQLGQEHLQACSKLTMLVKQRKYYEGLDLSLNLLLDKSTSKIEFSFTDDQTSGLDRSGGHLMDTITHTNKKIQVLNRQLHKAMTHEERTNQTLPIRRIVRRLKEEGTPMPPPITSGLLTSRY